MTTGDAEDLAAILATDDAIEARRQSIIARHTHDQQAPAMATLARISGLEEQLRIEVRLLTRQLGGAL